MKITLRASEGSPSVAEFIKMAQTARDNYLRELSLRKDKYYNPSNPEGFWHAKVLIPRVRFLGYWSPIKEITMQEFADTFCESSDPDYLRKIIRNKYFMSYQEGERRREAYLNMQNDYFNRPGLAGDAWDIAELPETLAELQVSVQLYQFVDNWVNRPPLNQEK